MYMMKFNKAVKTKYLQCDGDLCYREKKQQVERSKRENGDDVSGEGSVG